MNPFTVLEVALGIGLVYLLLSLFGSIINEMIAQRLSLRARTLRRGVRQLLGRSLADRLYDHGLVQGVMHGSNGPSYISPELFARALVDTVVGPFAESKPPTIGDIARGFGAVEDLRAREALLSFLQEDSLSVADVRANVERWYTDAMDRVTGWYVRRMRVIGLLTAAGIAVFFDVDSIELSRRLWQDPALRSAVAAQAEVALQSCQAENVSPAECSQWATYEKVQAQIHELPIGWGEESPRGIEWLWKGIGWVISALAISLGAPFWFDLLGKVSNISSSGKKPKAATA